MAIKLTENKTNKSFIYNIFEWNGTGKLSSQCPSPESQLHYVKGASE